MKKPFCPTFLRSDFDRNFFEDRATNAAMRKSIGALSDAGIPSGLGAVGAFGSGLGALGELRIGARTSPAPLKDASTADSSSPPQPKEMLTLNPTFMGMSVDLKELFRRAKAWWKMQK